MNDIDKPREGDLVRLEFGPNAAREGIVIGDHTDDLWLHEVQLNSPTITATRILRPVLQPGDRVRCTKAAGRTGQHDIGTVQSVDADGAWVWVDWDSGTGDRGHTPDELERLPAEPAPQPECPFPMGAKVTYRKSKSIWTVIGWRNSKLGWVVELDLDGQYGIGEPEYIDLVPQPTVEVGQWWGKQSAWPPDGYLSCVVTAVSGEAASLREPRDRTANWIGLAELRADWTRLDGPPQPPVGAVVAVRNRGDWLIAHRECEPSDGWTWAGAEGFSTWAGVLRDGDPATLRILAVLDPA